MQQLTKIYKAFNQMLSYKTFIKILLLVFVLFITYHASIWFFFTSKLLGVEPPAHIGDLARIGYYPPSIQLRTKSTDLPILHTEFPDWHGEPVDILTVGDSFSNGGASGYNPFYQDYLASKYNYRILNINPSLFGENYLEAIVAMINSGVIDQIKPKAILIESIERSAVGRFAKPIQWDSNATQASIINDLKNGKWGDGKPSETKQSFITTANYKLPLYNFYYLFSPSALGYSGSFKFQLTTPLFSAKADNTLLAYKQDITSIPGNTVTNISQMNDNFNHLSTLLQSKDIHLFVMFAVDKYDLYHDYIINNSYEKNPFYDFLRPLDKNYILIDTKAILTKELKQKEKDIYFADDTHWSYKASDAITSDNTFRLMHR